MIDWDAKAEVVEAENLVGLVRRRRASAGRPEDELATEGPLTESAGSPPAGERLDRLKASLARRKTDPDVAANIIKGAAEGLVKAADGVSALTNRDMIGLEAVVLTDGTRPSLTVQGGFIDLSDPEVGDWEVHLRTFEDEIRKVIAAVGRVNVPVRPFFAGTAWVVAPDLLITNRHVAEAIAVETGAGWRLRWPDATTIDFVAEHGVELRPTFVVTEIAYAGPFPIDGMVGFHKLDVALLRVKPIQSGVKLPPALKLDGGDALLKPSRGLYSIGFPGQPLVHIGGGTPPPGYEVQTVITEVFDGKFAVKKLAPGRLDGLPASISPNFRDSVFTHDASTLQGSSGSAVVDLDINGGLVVGIHFAGVARKQNYAHSFSRLKEEFADVANKTLGFHPKFA